MPLQDSTRVIIRLDPRASGDGAEGRIGRLTCAGRACAQVDVPHFTGKNWNYIKGAFMTIDRPYGKIFDFLHHRIGSTHVVHDSESRMQTEEEMKNRTRILIFTQQVHHIDCTIPHYHAKRATEALKATFPEYYLYDPTPVHKAMWRVARQCIAVKKEPAKAGPEGQDMYVFVPPVSA